MPSYTLTQRGRRDASFTSDVFAVPAGVTNCRIETVIEATRQNQGGGQVEVLEGPVTVVIERSYDGGQTWKQGNYQYYETLGGISVDYWGPDIMAGMTHVRVQVTITAWATVTITASY